MKILENLKKAIKYRRDKGVSKYFLCRILSFQNDYIPPEISFYTSIIEKADVKKGEIVLDVGCGPSDLFYFKNRNYGVVGLDKSEGMLKEAKERGTTLLDARDVYSKDYLLEMLEKSENNAVIIHGDARKLPFEENIFDATISKDVLQYIKERERVVEEMGRVVKPGKKVVNMITPIVSEYKLRRIKRKLKDIDYYDILKEWAGHTKLFGFIPVEFGPFVYGTKPFRS